MKTKQILLVDDSVDDLELAQRAIRKTHPGVKISVAGDGASALAMLWAPETERVEPAVVLLDYRMPRMDGADVLQAIRGNDITRLLPVVIVSSSNERADLKRCYELGANSYVRKPVNFGTYENVMRNLVDYWLTMNECSES